MVRAGICSRHDRIRRVATYGHFAKRRLPVQPGCSHAGGHVVPRLYYGLTHHVIVGVGISAVYRHSSTPEADGRTSGSGIGTTNLIVKYRPIVQDPHAWRPSIAFYSRLSLPTNRWFGTPEIPGGFTPLSRVPPSRFEAVAVTEGILFRKNLEPFRITGGNRRQETQEHFSPTTLTMHITKGAIIRFEPQ